MKEMLANLFGFIYTLSMGDYFFFIGTFLLIVFFIYIIYLIKCSEIEEGLKADDFDLAAVSKKIETEYKPERIVLTGYEEEQENNAIISYEELVKNKDKVGLDYDDEYIFDAPDLEVKKINLTTEVSSVPETKIEVRLMAYDKEEAFLQALKDLQKNLSN